MGAGYTQFVGSTNTLDIRGSITFTGYKRIEARIHRAEAVRSARHVQRDRRLARGDAGRLLRYRDDDDGGRADQLQFSAAVRIRNAGRPSGARLVLRARRFRDHAVETERRIGHRRRPSRPHTRRRRLPGLGAQPVYLHSRRPSASTRARHRGTPGAAASTTSSFQDFTDPGRQRSDFSRWTTRRSQHIPMLRDAWVLSLHGLLQTTYAKTGQQIPFFMMPSIGGGDDLRAYASWRLRDLNSLLLQAEWRVIVNRFLDMARLLRRRHGRGTARSDSESERPEERRRASAFAFTVRPRRRCASSWQRAAKASSLVLGRVPGVLRHGRCAWTIHRSSSSLLAGLAAVAGHHGRAASSTTTIRLPGSPRARTRRRRQAARHRAVLRILVQPVRHRQPPAVEHPRPATSTRSTKCPTRAGSPIVSARTDRPPEQASRAAQFRTPRRRRRNGCCSARSRRARIRASPRATPTARPGSCSSIRPSIPEASTADVEIATKLFWALGYNQVETFITHVRSSSRRHRSEGDDQRPSGERTPFTRTTSTRVLERAARQADGTYRASAGRLLPGKVLGTFRYAGTRSDDPNDLVPHEHRRELRALRVFGAWTNLVDSKAGNTLDTLVEENGRSIVKHYLQDVGSTFGMANNSARLGHGLGVLLRRPGHEEAASVTFGFALSPWQTVPYTEYPSIGLFEGDRLRPDDVEAADADDRLHRTARRRCVLGGAAGDGVQRRSDSRGGAHRCSSAIRPRKHHLADVLIKRRDTIGRAYLTAVNPIVNPQLDAGGRADVRQRRGRRRLRRGAGRRIAPRGRASTTPPARRDANRRDAERHDVDDRAPRICRAAPAASSRSTSRPTARRTRRGSSRSARYFRRTGDGWKLVGLERLPRDAARPSARAGPEEKR